MQLMMILWVAAYPSLLNSITLGVISRHNTIMPTCQQPVTHMIQLALVLPQMLAQLMVQLMVMVCVLTRENFALHASMNLDKSESEFNPTLCQITPTQLHRQLSITISILLLIGFKQAMLHQLEI